LINFLFEFKVDQFSKKFKLSAKFYPGINHQIWWLSINNCQATKTPHFVAEIRQSKNNIYKEIPFRKQPTDRGISAYFLWPIS
jgi:alpha-galactosidase/6-phospho-beta-glucosidase family protein